MASTIRYSANVSSDHHPNQVPGILIIMNPKQPNLPICSMHSTYLLFHLLLKPSLHLIANTILGIIMTTRKISPKTLNHSILSTSTNPDLSASFYHTLGTFPGLRITAAVQWITSYSSAICSTAYSGKFTSRSSFLKSAIEVRTAISGVNFS